MDCRRTLPRVACRRTRHLPWGLPRPACRGDCQGVAVVLAVAAVPWFTMTTAIGTAPGCHVMPWQFRGLLSPLPRHTANNNMVNILPAPTNRSWPTFSGRKLIYTKLPIDTRASMRAARYLLVGRPLILPHIFRYCCNCRLLVCVGRSSPKTQVTGAGPKFYSSGDSLAAGPIVDFRLRGSRKKGTPTSWYAGAL